MPAHEASARVAKRDMGVVTGKTIDGYAVGIIKKPR